MTANDKQDNINIPAELPDGALAQVTGGGDGYEVSYGKPDESKGTVETPTNAGNYRVDITGQGNYLPSAQPRS